VTTPQDLLAETVRTEGTRVLATLVRTLGDLHLAEDAVQDAVLVALTTWPPTGIPDDPRAWLTVAARRKALDVLRREATRPARELAAGRPAAEPVPDVAEEAIDVVEPESVVRDDLLRLVFTCCHPALAREAQVALALRTLAGLDVPAIARAFLVSEATMAKRLVRARAKISTARIPYRVPADGELPDRLPAVLAVVHLVGTEAHAPTGGDDVTNVDLEAEAVRLARLLADLLPGEPEVLGLLALLLLTSARGPARVDADGAPVLLADQDRSRWDGRRVAEGVRVLDDAVRRSGGVAGPYQLQAHLAACHSTARTWAETDWDRIVALYDLLLRLRENPAVRLNRAVALLERDGPDVAIAALDAAALPASHLWHAARAEALRRRGDLGPAGDELELALAAAPSDADRGLLRRRLDALRSAPA
jgi:RNA polymerase sigma-70 factor (ECF subfamily)